ncbi:phosphoglucomutase/phosphomannomutase family protein [Oscillatoria sp. FACHB-1407]|uniref:phosphoglucomutase/phosphomannomutase family protein n=1 Tax=Oscillatoria sp. FACHB-1407 TaxID=2692847 RepID=UPI0016831ECB|nr:phosphoglucomutase/phosphomannomutase family protein [Oscillatoria sp. FACHB-1407]MBD2460401.1 phosphoglucomutase/phosphomannomutase family protein [Oscillatoria sp. FACHB-1407]
MTTSIQFGTDGWRGIIADDFTFANVCRVTRAIAHYLSTTYSHDRPVLVAYDTRFFADQFAQTAAQVLVEAGWQVKMADRDCPTPAIAYHAKHLNSAGALMFTASHNPASYCGIKYIPDYAGPATNEITNAITAAIAHMSAIAPTEQNSPLITYFDPRPDYLRSLYQFLDVDRIRQVHLSVKYDALYSTSRGYLDMALQHCGCTVEVLHDYRDVLFGGGMPDPKGDRLTELIAAVRRDGAAVGLATDGDSDRYGIVDEQGNCLPPNTVMLLLARHLIKHKGKTGAIVRTVATTRLLDIFAQQHGLELYETPVGFKYIGQKMRETPVLIGGEESGGLSVLGHIPEKDGILANLLVLEAIAYENKPLSQLVNDLIAEVGGPLLNHRVDLRLSPFQRSKILQTFVESPPTAIAGILVKDVGYKDGIKLYLENGDWILLRLSGTEPLLRVYMETVTLEQQKQITQAMQEMIQAIG